MNGDLMFGNKRLESIGSELSNANKELLLMVSRTVDIITRIVPPDMYGINLGMNYSVHKIPSPGGGTSRILMKIKPGGLFRDGTRLAIKVSLEDKQAFLVAHHFASDVANGLIGQICDRLNKHLARTNFEINALKQEEAVLKKRLL